MIVKLGRVYGSEPLVEGAMIDIEKGRPSRTKRPVRVSRLDSPRGGFFVLDGYHRAVQAALAGRSTLSVEVEPFMPYIERTGGVWNELVSKKVPVRHHVARHRVEPLWRQDQVIGFVVVRNR
jgi:hypothetical protein